MAERPDLEYVVPILERELAGRAIAGVRLRKPVVLRLAVPGTPAALLLGRRIARVARRAHFVRLELEGAGDPLEIVIALMLAGRFVLAPADARDSADLALALALDDGRELRYRDDVQMGKVYVIPRGDWRRVPGLAEIGVDVLDPAVFTRERFVSLARHRRDQLKVFLMDKRALDALGNAYADEVLFEARLHPKTLVRSLSPDELDRLHDAIVKVLTDARDEIARRQPPLDEKLRDFLRVRNRHGELCPRCGATIRRAGVHGHDAFFCPDCQVANRKTGIVDWRRGPH